MEYYLSKRHIQVAGLLYLVLFFCGMFSMMYVPSTLFVTTDGALTALNIKTSETLFRIAMLSDTVIFLVEIVLSVLLFYLFKPVQRIFASVALYSRLSMTALLGINLIFLFIALFLAHETNELTAFSIEQKNELMLLTLKIHDYGMYIWQLFFGLHCAFLGILIFKSGFLPKLLGKLMSLGSLGYSLESIRNVLAPESNGFGVVAGVFLGVAVLAELTFTYYLLFKKLNVRTP